MFVDKKQSTDQWVYIILIVLQFLIFLNFNYLNKRISNCSMEPKWLYVHEASFSYSNNKKIQKNEINVHFYIQWMFFLGITASRLARGKTFQVEAAKSITLQI